MTRNIEREFAKKRKDKTQFLAMLVMPVAVLIVTVVKLILK